MEVCILSVVVGTCAARLRFPASRGDAGCENPDKPGHTRVLEPLLSALIFSSRLSSFLAFTTESRVRWRNKEKHSIM